MKTKMLVSLTAVTVSALLLTTGCTRPFDPLSGPYNHPAFVGPAAQYHADSKLLGAVVALDRSEINAAALAQHKATHGDVRRLADMMYREHNQNLRETELLGQRLGILIQQGPTAVALERAGARDVAHLERLNGSAFDRAYVNAMVKDHRAGLRTVNGLIRQAHDPMVKRHLEMTRDHIAMHLREAEALQHNLR